MSAATPALLGSCACGEIKFASKSLPRKVTVCNCVLCRKLSGAPFQIYAAFPYQDVEISQTGRKINPGSSSTPQGLFSTFKLTERAIRGACARCHSHLSFCNAALPDQIDLAVGAIDEASLKDEEARRRLRPEAHIFGRERTSWWDIETDGIPVHDQRS